MGLFSWLKKKPKTPQAMVVLESSKLKEELADRDEEKKLKQAAVSLERLEQPRTEILMPAVEHPLLSIQDRISKIEELYRRIDGKLDQLDTKVATKEQVEEVKSLIHEDMAKGDQVLANLSDLEGKIGHLRLARAQIKRKVASTQDQLTHELTHLGSVNSKLTLLESHKKILNVISKHSLGAAEVAQKLGYTRQYVWNRLKELEEQKVVGHKKDGRQVTYFIR